MRILGVDPGLGITGYGVISASGGDFKLLEAGIIKNSSQKPLAKRLAAIYKGVAGLVREYQPAVLVLEELYSHYKHHMTAIATTIIIISLMRLFAELPKLSMLTNLLR